MNESESRDNSFKDWLLSKQEWVEKTAGAVVLIIEILALLTEIYHGVPKALLTQLLNLFFLAFIYYTLRDDFKRKFFIDPRSGGVPEILKFSETEENIPSQIGKLVISSNELVGQLSNINGFIASTALLYFVLAMQYVVENKELLPVESQAWTRPAFHLLIDLLSYAGAFFLLRCFYVMYQETVDDRGKPILAEKTRIYIFLGLFFMTFDAVATLANPTTGVFVSEFICGVVNAVIFILFIARFENKLLGIQTWMLYILYLYAVLQTCLPFVTKGLLTEEMAPGLQSFLEEFSSIVLSCCLIGKVALSAVLLYVIKSKRLFYYFMLSRKLHREEEVSWKKFDDFSEEISPEREREMISYLRGEGSWVATKPCPSNVTINVVGTTATQTEATVTLVVRLQDSTNPQPTSKPE